ncbi:HAMP domain-containing protein [Virgibacillus halodenitrificans]|uniref:Heme sensor protein HssS n=1 Tax=Virgibacillus halodenitrificans TaxID=1482 RepID=A0AAC9NJB0_VIRHA|nr:HAMP domain-containing sensor histidine kinase [Virgibacillus halodenitrificans]APC46898.1 two-component sensor histidine kinase [Virgibacillus halodenitrificans]MCG1027512.1 HAMP domain-containing protein [Virgibacillus halodenitrificans]MEC2159267.1 HAMP domain-containing sensor histidine kinase [Virgibacillus halodenitrificans]
MRTLYVRIIITTMAIMIASAVIAFAVTNIYYQYYLKPQNDEKITHIANNIVEIYNHNNNQSIDDFLNAMTDLGYKFYLIDQEGTEKTFGDPFSSTAMNERYIEKILDGQVYHGIKNYPWKPFVTGFFDNELVNTIGVPVMVDGERQALFVRPNSSQQFGEMRFFLAVLLILTLLFSFLLVLVSTRYIVNPIKNLTIATKKIAAGNYHLKLKVKRKDEIGRLANDFSKMSRNLEQIEEKRQEFVSSVSHEIQSPLTSIQGFSKLIKEEELSKEERIHYLTIIEKESKRLSLLSKQLLTLSFLDSEKDINEGQKFDVAAQLRETIQTTEWQWREKNISIELDISSVYLKGDPRLLQQVWVNLVSNAIRYTDNNGKITLRTHEKKKEIDVVVEDTGIGITEENIPFLFDRFYKVDKARTRTEDSTGLGLAIVKKIIELHDGTIMVESTLGEGSRFIVTLPIDN